MRRWVWILLTLVTVGEWWELSFSAHPDNVAAQVEVSCTSPAYLAIQRVDIDSTDTFVRIHRSYPPRGSCTVKGFILQDPKHSGIAEDEYNGEMTVIDPAQ